MDNNTTISECEHDSLTFKRVDAEDESTLYREWQCDDCEATLSRPYAPTGDLLIIDGDGELVEVTDP